MKKKIMLLAFNARFTHSNLAIYALRTSLLNFSHDIDMREFTIHDDLLLILLQIVESNPDVIGISVYIWNSMQLKLLLPEIKKVIPHTKIILGGPEVSYNAEHWLDQFPMIDYIVCGAGETAFRRLAESDFSYSDRILRISNPDFLTLPFPYMSSDKELLKHKYVYYEASRGCPFHCSYCLSSREDQDLQYRDIETIKSELRQLWAFEPFIIKFIDRSFNVNQSFARQIWQFLKEESPDIMYHFEIHPLYLDEEDFNILGSVPQERFQFEIGIQSIHSQTIREIGRQGEWEMIEPKLRKLKEIRQIHQHYDAIVGLPFETKDKLGETINELLILEPDHLQLGFLKILPGTDMAKKTDEYGIEYLSDPPYRVLSTKWMSFAEIQSCENVEIVLNSYINSGHFPSVVRDCFELRKGNGFNKLDEFASYIITTGKDIKTKDWLKKAKIVQSFYQFNEQQRTLLRTLSAEQLDEPCDIALIPSSSELDELLLWDWILFPSNLQYPDFLPIHLLNEAKQESLAYLRSLPVDHYFWKSNDICLDDTRRAYFFKAKLIQTRKKCLYGKEYAMILKRQGKVQVTVFDIIP